MSELRVETYRMPAADLGGENPLPSLHPLEDANAPTTDEGLPEKYGKYFKYGLDVGVLPYNFQDNYDRNKKPRDFQAIVLENDILRATFLPEFGGKLWSLFHKPDNRELLHSNPVCPFGNFAIRNAWTTGGIEWNVSIYGHCVFTCSQMFAASLKDDDGTPILRMYEWERLRGVPYQMDFYLPDGSQFLFARMRIINPHDHQIPMYWWSNIGVSAPPDLRVIAPVESALRFGYENRMELVPIPVWNGTDVTYHANVETCADFFYCIDENQWPWETALHGDGTGLIQTSTSLLRGRKLFVWGTCFGGKHWQEFLSVPNITYLEIQAGLARTQTECKPMPAGADWSWLEAYTLFKADPKITHGSDWAKVRRHVETRLSKMITQDQLEAELRRTEAVANRRPEEILFRGSGWGALELTRRKHAGQKPFCSEALVFDNESLDDKQQPWLKLLKDGQFPSQPPQQTPLAWMVQSEWRQLLEQAVQKNHSNHWLSWLHLGVMYYNDKDFDKAKQAWQRSLELEPSACAYRNLAVLAGDQGETQKAADLFLKACELAPDLRPLLIECFQALLKAGRPKEVIDLYDALNDELRNHGRIKFLMGQAALELNDLETVENILRQENMAIIDLREGEMSLTNLWFDMHEKRLAAKENIPIDDRLRQRVRKECPPPANIDFRMVT